MTTTELHNLYLARQTALARSVNTHNIPLGRMKPEVRAEVEADSKRFHQLDRQIVAELREHPGPVDLPGLTLWLTSDALNFIATFPGTQRPLMLGSGTYKYDYSPTIFYRYNGREDTNP